MMSKEGLIDGVTDDVEKFCLS